MSTAVPGWRETGSSQNTPRWQFVGRVCVGRLLLSHAQKQKQKMSSITKRRCKRHSTGGQGPGAAKKKLNRSKLQTQLRQESDDKSTQEVSVDDEMQTDHSLSGDGDNPDVEDNESIKRCLRRLMGTVNELKCEVNDVKKRIEVQANDVEKRITAVERNQVPLNLKAGRHRSTISSVTHIAPAVSKDQKSRLQSQMKSFYRRNAFAGMKFIDTDEKGMHAWDVAEKQTVVPPFEKEEFPVADRIEWVKSTFASIRNATQTACRNNYMSKVTCHVCCDSLVLLTTEDLTNASPVCFECVRQMATKTDTFPPV